MDGSKRGARLDPGTVTADRESGEEVTRRAGREAVLLTARPQLTVTAYRLAPGQDGPAPHVHHRHTDAFYMLDGELSFVLGPDRERITVGAGGLVAAPPGVVHTFANQSGAEVSFLNLHAPDGGFADYMRGLRDGDPEASFDTDDPPPDGGRPLSEAIVSRAGEGERLRRANRVSLVKSSLPDLFLAEFELDGAFEGPGVHDHEAEVDCFYVTEGRIELTAGDASHELEPHQLASVPPGMSHTFSHSGSGGARFLNIHAPDAGFAEFIRRVSD
jgi:mannose-6-phosphate isomerase-like protein (cupin superfamily)